MLCTPAINIGGGLDSLLFALSPPSSWPSSVSASNLFVVKRNGEREIVYNVHKFMKTAFQVGITFLLSIVQKRVAEVTRVNRRTLCRLLKEGEISGTGVR